MWKLAMLSWLYVMLVIITFLFYVSGKLKIAKNGKEKDGFKLYVMFSLFFPVTWIMILMNLFRGGNHE